MQDNMLCHREDCRVCHSRDVIKFLSLGTMPLAGGFLMAADIPNEQKYPLDVYFCANCSLVQIMDVVPSEVLFKDYRYLSSVTKTLKGHFEEHAKELGEMYHPSFVVEIGANDGVLLEPLNKLGIKTVGFEPAENIAKVARSKGVNILTEFFTEKTAQELAKAQGQCDMLVANNVLAHIDNMDDIMNGISLLLKADGVLVFEVHYIADLIEKMQYDTIYHEHLCYYSIKALAHLLGRFGMEIVYVKRIPIHSGSISVHARKKSPSSKIDKSVGELYELEEQSSLHSYAGYREFANKVSEKRDELVSLVTGLKKKGARIAGYGAAGRATILLNFCNFSTDIIDYVIDESPERYGRLIPGVHIPIFPPSRLQEVDYILILAWSYTQEIMKKESAFKARGGRFIIPLPDVTVV